MGLTCRAQEKCESFINILVGKLKVKSQVGDLGVCRKIILKWILKKGDRMM
jgi:hypothetical protein